MNLRSIVGLGLLAVTLAGATCAATPALRLDVTYDPATRNLSGTLVCPLEPSENPSYFLLFPNLDREPNPYLGPRSVDARYPKGFESSSLDILEVTLLQGEERTSLTPRWLALPPTLQTYSLEETVLVVDPVETPSFVEIRFITHAAAIAAGDGGVTEDALTWRFGWYPLLVEDPELYVERDGVLVKETGGLPLLLPRATIDARLSLPRDALFATGADRVARVETGETSKTGEADGVGNADDAVAYDIAYDAPTRSFALFVAEGRERYVLDGDLPIEVVYVPGHEATARYIATLGRDLVADFSARYGAYPHDRLTIVETPNRDGTAFAADGIVFLSARYFTHRDVPVSGLLDRLTEFVVAHEIAHMWFGLSAGVDLDRDAWLSEGLAQAAAVAHVERRFGAFGPNLFVVSGRGIAEDFVRRQFGYFNLREHLLEFSYVSAVWEGFDEAVVKPMVEVLYGNRNSTRLYDKGYVIARALAAKVGDDAFERALRRAIAERSGDRLDAEMLRAFLEEESGQSLDAWFAAWVLGDATVDYAVSVVAREHRLDTHETTVRVTRDGGTPQDVVVEATLTSGATTRQIWDGEDQETTLVFVTPSLVARVSVDPEHRLPDRDRLNNHSPVKVVRAVQGAMFPLDAYVVATNPSTGEFSLSLLDRFRVSVGNNTASFALRTGREGVLRSDVSVAGRGLVGHLTYTHTLFSQPPTGSAAETWEPDIALSIGAVRLTSAGRPFALLRLALTDLPSQASAGWTGVGLDIVSTGGLRVSATTFGEARLWPGGYAQAGATLGYSLGDLPMTLRFSFSDLRAVALPPAAVRASGSLALEVANVSGEPYNLLNLAMVDAARARLFVRGGVGWTTLGGSGTTSAGLEAGIEQIVDLSTLGGLLSFAVRAGVATPLLGAGRTAVYVDISL